MITRELLEKQTKSKGLECVHSSIIGTAIKSEEKPKVSIKIESKTEHAQQIKVEAGEVHMTK